MNLYEKVKMLFLIKNQSVLSPSLSIEVDQIGLDSGLHHSSWCNENICLLLFVYYRFSKYSEGMDGLNVVLHQSILL